MRVFVAGASGVIGRPLTELLMKGGHEVVGMTRSQARAEEIKGRGAEAVVCDALDAAGVREAVAGARPDAVIHELTEIPDALEPRKFESQLAATNRLRREGTQNLVEAVRAAGVQRLVAQSIAFVYAPVGSWVKAEDAPLDLDAAPPLASIVGAITELERRVLEAEGIVLRYGYFYGPGTAFTPDGSYAAMLHKRRFPIVGSGDGRWSFVHVDDAAAATVAALQRDGSGVFNIVDDEPARSADWIPALASAFGAKPPRHVPPWLARLAAGKLAVKVMTTQRGASNAKAKRELGWTPAHHSWRDGFGQGAG